MNQSPPAAQAADRYDPRKFHEELVAHGLLHPSGVRGVHGRGEVFEHILQCFDALFMRTGDAPDARPMMFPPIVARELIEKMGYLGNFPQLIGSVHSFFGSDAQAREMAARAAEGERWEDMLDIAEVMLLPAACYPVYPLFGGLLPQGGRLVSVVGWCFRHEPSHEPTRMQSFRMRELVRVGAPEAVQQWRDDWLARGMAMFRSLGLPVHSEVANDPFFGKTGRLLAESQREMALKFEIVVPVVSLERPTAICSFNWHQEHFTGKFGIRQSDSAVAHTACIGLGLDRSVLALFKTHGMDPDRWPQEVRSVLRL
ncbi:amino acid--[acyl-carrier-protein] ligase [Variovorax robiniae]|uniref:Amino acid--[acyl-carrier-protein] ligase n=1 Tax=Variovorax robiniae TaxID=1836199 RepID=A0ABU8X9N5_9BURK